MKAKFFILRSSFLMCLLLLLFSCGGEGREKPTPAEPVAHDLPQIQDSGRLVALTLYSSTSYFMYRGQDMGFQYELAEQFARSLGLELEVKVARGVRDMVRMLRSGEGDLIAYALPVTK